MELLRNIRVDSVSRLNPAPSRQMEADRTVAEAVEMMRREQVGCLLITKNGELRGVFTERDLLTRVLAEQRSLQSTISSVMTCSPICVEMKDSIRTAMLRMQEFGHRHLPVIDENNYPVGVLSSHRIINYLVEHFPTTVYNQPPDPSRVPDSPEGA